MDVGDGQAVGRIFRKDAGRVWKKDVPPQEPGAVFPRAQHKGTAEQEIFLSLNTGGDYPKLPNASEEHEASRG